MPVLSFSANLQRHLAAPTRRVEGDTVNAALAQVFTDSPRLRSYIVDERGALRKHVVVFVNGTPVRDRDGLSDPLRPDDQVDIFQALSGG